MRIVLFIVQLLIITNCSFSQKRNHNETTKDQSADSATIISIEPDTLETNQISIASWNLKRFGNTKLNDHARMSILLDILKQYDIIAIQEVMDVTVTLPQKLVDSLNVDGLNYNFVASNRVGRGTSKEQYLFVYNDDKVDAFLDSSGYGIEPMDEFAREPFYCMFKAGEFDFYLMTIHTDPDDVEIEIPALKVAFDSLQNANSENDIILLGDFNACSPGSEIDGYIEMTSLEVIQNIYFAIEGETNTRGGKSYDNIIFQSSYTSEFVNSGINVFEAEYNLTNDEAFGVSDHLPVWAIFNIDNDDD